MNIDLNKEDLINLICGLPAPGELESSFVIFNGNQWNTSFAWNRKQLQTLSESSLYGLYRKVKELFP